MKNANVYPPQKPQHAASGKPAVLVLVQKDGTKRIHNLASQNTVACFYILHRPASYFWLKSNILFFNWSVILTGILFCCIFAFQQTFARKKKVIFLYCLNLSPLFLWGSLINRKYFLNILSNWSQCYEQSFFY